MKKTTYSPVIEQYISIKKNHPNAILLYRMGDFYEMFFEDAKRASKILDITLTRKINKNIEIPMAGIPHHAINNYIGKIIKLGIHIVICEQTGTYDKEKKLMNRKVVKIITPGTITDIDLLKNNQSNFILSILNINKLYYCACCDIMNGELFIFFCNNKSKLEIELFKLQPREAIGYQQSVFDFFRDPKIITKVPGWEFNEETSISKVNNHFKINYSNMLKRKEHKICLRAVGALISYLEHTQCKKLDHLETIKIENYERYLNMDAITIKNLELVQNMQGEKKDTLLDMMNSCKTSMGSRMLIKWILNPISNTNIIKKRYASINCLKKNDNYIFFRNMLSNVKDIERITGRISLMNVNPKELIKMKNSLEVIPSIKKRIASIKNDYLDGINNNISSHKDIFELLCKSISENVKGGRPYGEMIKIGYNEKLDKLKESLREVDKHVSLMEKTERERTKISNLKIKFNKIQGFYIEVSKSKIIHVPNNYIKKQSLKNVERYTTEELNVLEISVLKKKNELFNLEKYLYALILNFLKNNIRELKITNRSLCIIDIMNTLCERSVYFNFNEPILVNKKSIKIVGSSHPVIFNKGLKRFVLNDIYFDDKKRMFIITGPNMGGKSTYMRQLALIIVLSHMGCFVPAKKSIIGYVDGIFTRIGSSDNIALNQSTFMNEMLETSYIIKNATTNSLILLDEVGRGTSVFDGLSIAWATALTLYKTGSYTLFATHYFEMTKLKNILRCCDNLYTTARIHNENLFLMYKIKKGSVDQSYGIHVAKLAGLNKETILEAEKKLLQLKKKYSNINVPVKKKENQSNLENLLTRLIKENRHKPNYLDILYAVQLLLKSVHIS